SFARPDAAKRRRYGEEIPIDGVVARLYGGGITCDVTCGPGARPGPRRVRGGKPRRWNRFAGSRGGKSFWASASRTAGVSRLGVWAKLLSLLRWILRFGL